MALDKCTPVKGCQSVLIAIVMSNFVCEICPSYGPEFIIFGTWSLDRNVVINLTQLYLIIEIP